MAGNNQYLQSSSVAYASQGLTVSYSAPTNQQLLAYSVSAYNGTASENSIGLFHSISDPHVKLYKILAAGDADFTTQIQAGTAVSIFNTTNNDGCLFQSKEKFNMIAFNVSQVQTGSPVYAYTYWNGSTYSTLTLLNTPVYTATGTQVAVFNAPIDWVAGDGSEDANAEFYSIRVISTTAPSQAVQINSLKVGKMLKYSDFVLPGSSVSLNFEDQPYLLQAGEAIIPFFSYTNASNRLEITYKINP